MKKYLFIALILILVLVPVMSQAMSINEQIAALQAQLATLLAQLDQTQQSLSFCPVPTIIKNLTVGSRGNEVSSLQQYLIGEGFLDLEGGGPTGYFGALTKGAVISWQRVNNVWPITGFFGPVSRAKLVELCGRVNPNGITINSVSGPTSLTINQTGTWSVNATAPADAGLMYSVDWGDNYSPTTGAKVSSPTVSQTATFTHSYSYAGTYTVRITVSGRALEPVQTSLTVIVGNNSNPVITVTYPKGGENMVSGDPLLVRWNPNTPVSIIEIVSTNGDYSMGIYGPKYGNNSPITIGEFRYILPNGIPPRTYHIRVSPTNNGIQAISKTFSINQINQPSITVLTSITSPVATNGIVTITGNNFTASGNVIHVGSVLQTSVSSSDRRTLRFGLGSRVSAGTYPVYITNSRGTSNILYLAITNPTVSQAQVNQLASAIEVLRKLINASR